MAIISNFELLAKPIAPPGGPATEIARLAIQGYFVEISNLENFDIFLTFRTRTSLKGVNDSVNTELTNINHAVVYDITQDNNTVTTMTSAGQLIPGKQLGHSVVCLRLPAGQTASLALLPNVQNVFNQTIPNDLAIRGYTEILLNSFLSNTTPAVLQAPNSARILVAPDHRSTYVDPEFDPLSTTLQTDLDFDQTVNGLPTANGQALQKLTTYVDFNDVFNDKLTADFSPLPLTGPSEIPLNNLSSKLFDGASTSTRTTRLPLGSEWINVEYSIKKGKYTVSKKAITAIVDELSKKKKIKNKTKIDVTRLTKIVNQALGGSARQYKVLQDLIGKHLKE